VRLGSCATAKVLWSPTRLSAQQSSTRLCCKCWSAVYAYGNDKPFRSRQMHADTSARSTLLWILRYLHCTLQTFQCGKAKVREQPAAPVAVRTQPISSKVTVSQVSASSSPSGDPVSDQRQKLTASPGSQHTGTSLLSGAQASSSNATLSATKSVKRKHGGKVEQLPSLQDAPGVPEKLGDHPLRLIIVGHNPSDHAW